MNEPVIYIGDRPARQVIAEREARGYQAGATGGPNMRFHPRRSTGDADIRRGLRLVVDRCRDQAINNPSIRGAIRRIVNNTVRDGIAPRFLQAGAHSLFIQSGRDRDRKSVM